MRLRSMAVCSFLFALAGAPAAALAQDASPWDFGAPAVGVQYDLSGVGNTPGLALRASRDVSNHVALELRGLFAKPDQQSGPSTFVVPEVQVQYRWRVARITPYVGAGGGLALVKSPFRTDWDSTVSVAAGTGVRLTDRVGMLGELRLRGIERRFTGSTAEWSLGMTWRLPSF